MRGRVVASAGFALALAVAVAVTTEAAPAGSHPWGQHFNRGELRLGPSQPLKLGGARFDRGTINPATGEFTVPAEHAHLPTWFLSAQCCPWTTLDSTARGPVTGSFHLSSGRLDMTVPVRLVFAECDFNGCPVSCEFKDRWQLSTENGIAGLRGARFVYGHNDGAGAVVTSWNDLPARSKGDAAYCDSIRSLYGGPGALRLAQHLDFDLSVRPEKRTVEQGEWTSFTTVAKNASGDTITGVRVCVRRKTGIRLEARPPQESGTQGCGPTGDLAPGEAMKTKFFAKAWNAKPRLYRLKFIASSTEAGLVRAGALRITRK
jgi:hypothetical protein